MDNKHLIVKLIFLIVITNIITAKSLNGKGSYGCTVMDHSTCDEVCKTDGFWYGHCKEWNGIDFQCKCFDYKLPLDSIVCKNYKDYCNNLCMTKSKQNGYCYPAADRNDPRGTPQCNCFKELPQEFML